GSAKTLACPWSSCSIFAAEWTASFRRGSRFAATRLVVFEFDGLSTGIVAHRGILALRDGEPSETKRPKQEGLSTMITSREIRLKSRPPGMPSADNFELATVSVPRPAPGEVQVQNLWMTVDPYMRNRMAHRASYAPSSEPGKEVHGGAIGEI